MANPNPSTRQSYLDVANPRLITRHVLVWLHKESGLDTFIVVDVAKHYGVSRTDAGSRISALKKWGCIRIVMRGKGNRPHVYEITKWGIKMAQKWDKEE